jgi:hypothetical protein
MKLNSCAFLAVLAAVLLASVNGREIEENTKVAVVKLGGNNGKSLLQCQLVVINMRHFMTSAVCGQFVQALEGSPNSLEVSPVLPLAEQPTPFQGISIKFFYFSTEFWTNYFHTDQIEVEKVTIHPNYNSNQKRSNNIAIIKTKKALDSNQWRALPYRGLTLNTTYTLLDTLPRSVFVFGPQLCDAASPQAFCSKYMSQDAACFASPASPLISGNSYIDGFLINEGSCNLESNSYNLYYHSVGDFNEWINEVAGATMATKVSIFTLLSAVLISFTGFM